jgi:hypothetical protein
MPDTIRSVSTPAVHSQTVVNPDGTNIGDSLPTAGSNPSDTYTEVVVGDVTTTTQLRVIGSTTYQKIFVENDDTGVTTISAWEEV